MGKRKYDVAISFAGEDRAVAEEIKAACQERGISVFYDFAEKAELWGKNLADHLPEVYRKQARFCLVLVSSAYKRKRWTILERRSAQARAFMQDAEYVLPLKIEAVELDGLLPTVAYLTWKNESASSVAEALRAKLLRKDKGKLLRFRPEPTRSISTGTPPTISHLQNLLFEIYKERNKSLSYEYLYGYLSRTSAYLSKRVTDGAVKHEDFIRPLSWLLAIATKLGIDVEESFVSRFPGRCPTCGESVCVCLSTGKRPPRGRLPYEVKDDLEWKRSEVIQSGVPITLDFAAKTISLVYPGNAILWRTAGFSWHFVKLQEEVAEVHEAMISLLRRTKSTQALSDEVADVLSWLVSAWTLSNPQTQLDREFIAYYLHGCPVCARSRCVCEQNLSRARNLYDAEGFVSLAGKLATILSLLPDNKESEDLNRAAQLVVQTQDDALARNTLFDVRAFAHRELRSPFGRKPANAAKLKELMKIADAVLSG